MSFPIAFVGVLVIRLIIWLADKYLTSITVTVTEKKDVSKSIQ